MQRLLLLPIVVLLASPAFAEDWNQWRGPNRNGVIETVPLIDQLPEDGILEPLWVGERIPAAFSGGWSSPVVADGKVYLFAHAKVAKVPTSEIPQQKFLFRDRQKLTDQKEIEEFDRKSREERLALSAYYKYVEQVHCVDAETGKTNWVKEIDSVYTRTLQSSTPFIQDGRVYALCAGLLLRCIDADDGSDVWTTKLPVEWLENQHYMSSPTIIDGVLVVLADRLFGVDPATGELLWQTPEEGELGRDSSAVAWKTGEKTYGIINTEKEATLCFDPKSGEELWRTPTGAYLATPIVLGDTLITYGNSRQKGVRCYGLSPEGTTHRWTFNGLSDNGSSPVVVGNYVYVQGRRRLACVDLKTGKAAWSRDLNFLYDPKYTSLIAADGKVFYGADGVMWFEATGEKFNPLVIAQLDRQGRMATEETHRRLQGLDELERQGAEGQEEAAKKYEIEIRRQSPTTATTPAIVDGRLFVRRNSGLACYDLRESSK